MNIWRILKYARIYFEWNILKTATPSYLPDEISVEATNVCNFKCKFCPQSSPQHHELVPRTYLSPADAAKIFTALRQGGMTTEVLHWTLDGEPFMNKKFGELCQTGIDHAFSHFYFATNGMLLSDENIRKLPRVADTIYTFTIDFCANSAYFESVRGTQGSWQTVKNNIQRILSANDANHLRIEIQDISSYDITDSAELQARFQDLQTLFVDPEKRLKIYHKTFHNAAGTVAKTESGAGDKNKYHICPYPWTSLFVASNGDVVACCRDLRRQTVLGNILQQPLTEIWRGAAFQDIRRKLASGRPDLIEGCASCDLPYDGSKFSVANVLRVLRGRLQVI